MSWPYCEPKSRIRMRSLSGAVVISIARLCEGNIVFRPQSEQLFEDRFVVDGAVAAVACDVDFTIFEKFDLPIFTRSKGDNHNSILARMFHRIGNLRLIE